MFEFFEIVNGVKAIHLQDLKHSSVKCNNLQNKRLLNSSISGYFTFFVMYKIHQMINISKILHFCEFYDELKTYGPYDMDDDVNGKLKYQIT